jgi:hypothetical protein
VEAVDKQLLSRLSEADFQQFPCWEVLPDEVEDDAWVRPADGKGGDGRYSLVAAVATLADGRQYRAFVHVADYGKLRELGPVTVFPGSGQLRINASNPATLYRPSPEELQHLPMRWVLSQCLEGERDPRKGSASASRITRFFKQLAYQSRLQALQRQTYAE